MRRYSLTTTRRLLLVIGSTLIASLGVATTAAQAVVVDMNPAAAGQASVTYPSDYSYYYGVALPSGTSGGYPVPGEGAGALTNAQIPYVTTSAASCSDPALSSDFTFLSYATPLCWHGGGVVHNNDTFALTWDQHRQYWQGTKDYVQQFLKDVATGSGSFSSPYSIAPQYTDGSGRAGSNFSYGGACVDFGNTGHSSCQFPNSSWNGAGYDFTSSCSIAGFNMFFQHPGGLWDPTHPVATDTCLTDSDIQGELQRMVTQAGIIGRSHGYAPLMVVLTPPDAVVCLDSLGKLCSVNADSSSQPAHSTQFCSYHGQTTISGTLVSYIVQPWVAGWNEPSSCDDPTITSIPLPVPVDQLATDVGMRLVSPLSQAQMATIVNPTFNGWFTDGNGSEINDDGCVPMDHNLDSATVGTSGQNPYLLQREFNNAGAITSDPNALSCIDWTNLTPQFVMPSAVNPGDVIELDGSTTVSSLLVSGANYQWNFGDGTAATGPSVVHAYNAAGTYNVTLRVTDRGGNVNSLTQTIQVGSGAQPGGPGSTTPTAPSTGGGGSGSTTGPALSVHLQMLPQSLKSVLSKGIAVRVTSNRAANGIASVWITRAIAKRAHIKTGKAGVVRIGLGTVASISNGTVTLRLHLSPTVAKKLRGLGHVSLTVRLALVSAGNHRLSIVAAGRY